MNIFGENVVQKFHTFNQIFWTESFWLPPNVTWNDVASQDSNGNIKRAHPNVVDLLYSSFILMFVMLLIRFFITKYYIPIVAKKLGIVEKKCRPLKHNAKLEQVYQSMRSKPHREVILVMLKAKTDLTEKQIENWLRLRRNQNKRSRFSKFSERHVEFFEGFILMIFGLTVLWNKPWFWNLKIIWDGFPHQGIEYDIWWYYIVFLGYYYSVTVLLLVKTKRSDFWEMLFHHVLVIVLIYLAWLTNSHRMGSIVLLIHDPAQVILDFGKSMKYAGKNILCVYLFIIFVILWVYTRLYLFPFWVIYNFFFSTPDYFYSKFTIFHVSTFLLLALQCLHVFWTYFIIKVAILTAANKSIGRDVARSSSSSMEESN